MDLGLLLRSVLDRKEMRFELKQSEADYGKSLWIKKELGGLFTKVVN